MSADVTANGLPDSKPLYRLIGTTRRLLRSTWVVTGLGLTVGLLLGALVATTGADMLLPLDPAWNIGGFQLDGLARLLALLVVIVPAAVAVLVGVIQPLLRRLAPVQVARRIEKKIPGIHNRLVSVLDLDHPKQGKTVSPTFHRRLLNEALERIRNFRPGQVLDTSSLRKAGLFAFSSTAAFALAWVLFSDRLPTAMARIMNPFADIPPASSVNYAIKIYSPTEDEDAAASQDEKTAKVYILREEDIVFQAEVVKGDPKKMRLELYSEKDRETRRHELIPDKANPNLWTLRLDSARLGKNFEDGFKARVYGGGTWSRLYSVSLVERPVITGTQTAIHYPAYMRKPEPRVNPLQTSDVSGPERGQVEVLVQADGSVATGEVQLLEPSRRKIATKNQIEKVWFEDKVPVGATAEGTWAWERMDRRQVHTEPASVGAHVHLFQGDPVGLPIQSGDTLYTYVYLPTGNPPEAIMLQWHDGENWDHGAYWGKDVFKLQGKANSPSRRNLGSLPEAGKWARLEVPAAAVGLEGKLVRGMAFWLSGGQAFWNKVGTVRTEEESFSVLQRFPMTKRDDDGRWSGKFTLQGNGLYRAELRNAQKHPNKPMPPAKFTSLPDLPPTVKVERPDADVTLGQPGVVPLTIVATDTYGLDEVNLLVRGGEGGDYQVRNLARFGKPEEQWEMVAPLTEAAKLTLGGSLRYLVEAKDTKGQTTRTREYTVKISAEGNTADQQLNAFDKAQDPFRDRLAKLLGDQKKVAEQIDKMTKENAAVVEKVKKEEEKARLDPNDPSNKIDPKTGKPEAAEPALKLDPETAKKLADLQKALAELAKTEDQVAAVAQQINADLAKQVEAALNLDLIPKPLGEQMQEAQKSFNQQVAQAMKDFANRMNKNADPKQNAAPDLKGLQQQADRIVKELEAAKAKQDALAEARKAMRDDLKDALKKLQKDMLNQAGDLSARELQELRDFLAKMREDMKNLMNKQDDLAKDAANANDADALANAERKQMALDKELERMMNDAKELLDRQQMSKDYRRADRRRKPEFPNAPFEPDGDETKVPPKEKDSNEPLPGKKNEKKGETNPSGKRSDKKKDLDDEDEDKFMPALAGKREKIDERFAKKERPLAKKGEMDARKDDLQNQQNDRQADLDAAEKSLAADQGALDKMLDDLRQTMKGEKGQKGQKGQKGEKGEKGEGEPKEGQGQEGEGEGESLQQMLQSEMMRAAKAMAGRMKQTTPFTGRTNPQQAQRPPMGGTQANKDGNQMNALMEAELGKLDPASRALILKLPARLREDLLQGMQEDGPEGYLPFIQDYFKRLTETKEPGKP